MTEPKEDESNVVVVATDETTPSSSDEKLIKNVAERLRFFFSDANLRADYFMRTKVLNNKQSSSEGGGEKLDAGFIPIEVLLKFNSIKCHTTDPAVVVKATKTLCADRLVLNAEENSVGRVVPFTMAQMDENIPLSLYVSNLPISTASSTPEGENNASSANKPKYAVSVPELRALFEPYGTVALVKLRFKSKPENDNGNDEGTNHQHNKSPRKKRGKWNYPAGGAFVEYETATELKAAADDLCTIKEGESVEPKKALTLGGNKLEVVTLKEWLDDKKEKREAQEKKKKDDETPSASSPKEEKSEETTPKKRDREEEDKNTEKEVEEFTIDWKPQCVISIKGLSDTCDREAIRGMVAEHMGVSDEEVVKRGIYADFSRGQTSGALRFSEPSDTVADIAAKLNSGELLIAGGKVESASVLEGEEESKYWADFIDFKNKQIKHRAEERTGSRKKKFRRGRR